VDLRRSAPFLVLAAVLGAVGCTIALDGGPGQPCSDDTECPDAYGCVAAADGQGSCEVVYPPRPSASGSDGGTDAGPAPTYCRDIEPILAATCVSSCHGADHRSGVAGFRLDYYAPDGGGAPGAKAKAERIKARAADLRSMPPPGSPAPTAAQRALLARWVLAGAPECATTDGGTPDAGNP
jgi:hypothetical protein